MNKIRVAQIALIGGIGVTGWLALREPVRHEKPALREEPPTGAANAALASRRATLAAPAKVSPDPIVIDSASIGTGNDVARAQDSPGDAAVAEDTLLVNREPISREELTFRLETQFREEGPSDRAGRDLERSISAQFVGQGALAATLNAAECRRQLCRIDLTAGDKYAASKAFEGLYRGALVGAGGALGPSYEALPDGRVRLVIYAAQRGEIELL
jgi:hypothetical protein